MTSKVELFDVAGVIEIRDPQINVTSIMEEIAARASQRSPITQQICSQSPVLREIAAREKVVRNSLTILSRQEDLLGTVTVQRSGLTGRLMILARRLVRFAIRQFFFQVRDIFHAQRAVFNSMQAEMLSLRRAVELLAEQQDELRGKNSQLQAEIERRDRADQITQV